MNLILEEMNNLNADGVDFVPLSISDNKSLRKIIKSYTKEEWINTDGSYPKSNRLYWNIIGGEKVYCTERDKRGFMNLEESVKDVIQQKLADGTVEKIMTEKLEKGISDVMDDLLRSYGSVGKAIKDKLKEVMIPAVEKHDFSKHIVKLDTILTDIVNQTSLLENQKLLENFKDLMLEPEIEEIKTSELFEKWFEYVAGEVNTSNLEIDYTDRVSYQTVSCKAYIEYADNRSWSIFKDANIIFECEQDKNMNFIISITTWKERDKFDKIKWDINYNSNPYLNSLRFLNKFELFLMKLNRSGVKLIIDDEEAEDDVQPEAEPEASFS